MKLIASLKHTSKNDEHITFWRPAHRGYTPVLTQAGHYNDAEAAKLNDGENHIAVEFDEVLKLSKPTPYFRADGKSQFYDNEGPVVENGRANWNRLIAVSMEAGRSVAKPKPEVFRGYRRAVFGSTGAPL